MRTLPKLTLALTLAWSLACAGAAKEDADGDGVSDDVDDVVDGDTDVADDAYEGDDGGECADGADNDRDGAFDCDDADCDGSPDCEGDEDTGEATPDDAVYVGSVHCLFAREGGETSEGWGEADVVFAEDGAYGTGTAECSWGGPNAFEGDLDLERDGTRLIGTWTGTFGGMSFEAPVLEGEVDARALVAYVVVETGEGLLQATIEAERE